MKYNIEKQRKSRKRSWKNNSLVILLMVIILTFSIRAVYRVYGSRQESMRIALEKKRELQELESRVESLSGKLERISTPAGKEAALREKFGVGSEGENVAIIVEGTSEDQTETSSGFWYSIRNFFSNIF